MDLASLVTRAAAAGASDLHIQSGRPLALRVDGELSTSGEPIAAAEVEQLLRQMLDPEELAAFSERGSFDLALELSGRRCRVNLLRSAGGPGLALRLLSDDLVTVDTLNLHPDFKALAHHAHGLVLVTGPTGSGKSSTLAALVQEVNLSRTAHIVTLEQPIEYDLLPIRAYIRQREVGRDTPSFAQGLMDAAREDIDVLVVGELRDRETMRLTLDAAETGHLVLATLHSATPTEALQRVVSAFPAAEQPSVCAQLADVILGVVTQHLVWRDEQRIRVPECELLLGTQSVKAVLRKGELFKLRTVLETGGREGMWTADRYRAWLDDRTRFHRPGDAVPGQRGAPAADARRPGLRRPNRPEMAADEAPDVWVIPPEAGTLDDVLDELDGPG